MFKIKYNCDLPILKTCISKLLVTRFKKIYSVLLTIMIPMIGVGQVSITSTEHVLNSTASYQQSLQLLVEGNNRFVNNVRLNRDLLNEVEVTKDGQYPHTAILSCMDSRVPLEYIFDQGIGDLFSIRVAGNVLTDEVIGSMEYACNLAGTTLIVVLGHSHCGAVSGACKQVSLGKLDSILERIHPIVEKVKDNTEDFELSDKELAEVVARENVKSVVRDLPTKSPSLARLVEEDKIAIIGAYYDIETGRIELLE